jgi:histone acetyltransferase (RNA polymerase elongator complex component)
MTPVIATEQIESYLHTIPADAEVEIAFFGGSFTAIPRNQMVELLRTASPYLDAGRVSALRISTRPDAIDEEILAILAHYGVKTIELGIQSMSDRVLGACKRGHTAQDSYHAAELIVSHGFNLGGQMMIGLPSSTEVDEQATAQAIIQMGAKEARIYPVVVFAGTALAFEMKSGNYAPLSVEEAALRTATPLELFLNAQVKLLRVGLCETESLHAPGQIIGGAYHPALGELCYSAFYLKRIGRSLSQVPLTNHLNLKISVAPGKLSMAIGQKRCNDKAIRESFSIASLRFAEDPTLTDFDLRVDLIQ